MTDTFTKTYKEKIQNICFQQILPLWESCPDTFPDFLTEISETQKKENELFLNTYIPLFQEKMSHFPENQEALKIWISEIEHYFKEFVSKEKIIKILQYTNEETFSSLELETKNIIKKMRSFDQDLGMEDIWQAIRNYFIYIIILQMENKQPNSRDSILAYSLLYPYTDNFIDDSSHNKKEKQAFNLLIKNTLKGKEISPETPLEEKTVRLLRMALSSFPKDRGKTISSLLLLMLDAQEISLKQQKQKLFSPLTEQELLEISSYKGGMSVLIDYYLSMEELKEDKMKFYLEFGYILQLADDLQDLKEDKKKHSHTIMTRASKQHNLDKKVNKLLHFIHRSISSYEPENARFKPFVLQNCFLMILTNILSCKKSFSKNYLKQIENFLPFSIHFFQTMQGNNMPDVSMNVNQLQLLDIFLAE